MSRWPDRLGGQDQCWTLARIMLVDRRTVGHGYSVRLHAGATPKDGCHSAGGR